MTKTQAWWQFLLERFHPWAHLLMIAIFITVHYLITKAVTPIVMKPIDGVFLLIGIVAFYFKLKLFDEVKDYEYDTQVNYTRPLPRGLLTHKDMYRGMFVCVVIELFCFSFGGVQSFITGFLAIVYSLFMYKDFFIKEKLRPYLTTYALVHTIVTAFISFTIFSFLTKDSIFEIITNPTLLYLALTNWLLFNVFEFGRETFARVEEKENIDTYSSIFGRTGAVMLVATQAVIAHYLAMSLKGANSTILLWGFGIMLFILAFLSLNLVMSNTEKAAKNYRLYTSLYIVLFYIVLVFAHFFPSSPSVGL